MASVGTIVRTSIAAPLADGGNTSTTWWTATIADQTNAIELRIPFRRVTMSLGSIPPQVNAYLSTDGGATFASFNNPFITRSLTPGAASAGTTDKTTLILPGGYWALAVNNGTSQGVTSTVALDTVQVHTANYFA